MKVAIAYCYPQVNLRSYFPLASRFMDTYRKFPAGEAHELHVICNGGEPGSAYRAPFKGTSSAFHVRDNTGWDIGSYQWAAENIPCDLLVCLGAPVHFHRSGWLVRMVESYLNNAPCLCGCWAYLHPNWHVRTTAFWTDPNIIRSYPYVIGSARSSRYDFEHGKNSITRHVLKADMDCIMVSWKGEFGLKQWSNHAPGTSDSLVHDQFVHNPGSIKTR